MDRSRIKRLSAQMLLTQHDFNKREIERLQREKANHRANAIGQAAVDQMAAVAKLDELRDQQTIIESEIRERKASNRWDPQPVQKEMIPKKNTPIPPSLTPAKAASVEHLEGEELPIKVKDGSGFYRVWRPEDGPIHGTTPEETITDVSQTTARKSD